MATQRDIAEKLKLSPGTVSRALRGQPGLAPETRFRVLEAAAEIDYKVEDPGEAEAAGPPRAGGAADKTTLLGMLVYAQPESLGSNGTFVRMLRGASEAARQLGVGLHVDYVQPEEAARIHERAHQPLLLRRGELAGLLMIGLFPAASVAELNKRVPCVRMHLRDFDTPLDCIAQDDHAATDALVAHLVARGHERIGFFCTRGDLRFTYGRMRFAAYLESLVHHGLKLDPELWVRGAEADDPASVAEAMGRAEALSRSGVTAWVGVHDIWAYRLMRHLQDAGLRVPRDVALCGFDDLETPRGLVPMTSVAWPLEDMGATAARRLFRRIHQPALATSQSLYTGTLAVKASTGAKR